MPGLYLTVKKMSEFLQTFFSTECQFLKVWAPIWLHTFATISLTGNVINFFSAQMGEMYLAGVSFGSLMLNTTILAFMLGYTSVLDVYGPASLPR